MSMRETSYVEDSTFTLSYIENDALFLGALWNCHLSKPAGYNLFAKKLTSDHLAIHPLKNLDYHLIHVKSIEDKLTTLKISGAMSIEILSGILNVEGSGYYDTMSSINSNEEQLICQYNLDNYLVELLPQAKEVMDNIVKNNLFEKKIKATHVVRSIILGARVSADIRIRRNDTSKNTAINGRLIGGIPFGKVNAALKTSLEVLDSKNANDYDMQITISSKPPMKQQPTTINQMFNLIENVDACIQEEQHYKFIGSDIYGVPIRFILVPVSQFLEIEVEKLYKQLNDSIFENFRTTLIALKDYQSSEYVKNCVIRTEYRLQKILSDSQSQLSKDIIEYQKNLKKVTNNYFERACETLKKYKIAECDSDKLLQIIHDYDKSDFSIVNVCAKLESFVSYGKYELNGVYERDAALMNLKIIYFTNSNELNEWLYSGINVKLLLWTGIDSSKVNSTNGAFQSLFKIVNALQERNIEVGIALPSISNDFSLVIKDNIRSETYSIVEIPQILKILSAAVGMGNPIESRFYMLNALHSNIQLPLTLEKFSELNNLISLLKIDFKIYFAHSYLDSLQKIRSSNHDGFRWKAFIALDAPDTALDAVYEIKNLVSKSVFSEIEWIAGESNIRSSQAAPLLLVFYDGEIKAVCLDKLDLLILSQIFKSKDLSVLSCASTYHSLYPDRSQFSLEFIKIVDQTKMYKIEPINEISPFNQVPNQILSDALNVVRSASLGKDLDIISSIAQLAIKNGNELSNLLIKYGWSSADSKFNKVLCAEDSKSLYNDLQIWLKSRDPFLAKIEYAKSAVESVLKSFDDNKAQINLEDAIKLISNDPKCRNEIKTNFEVWKLENDLKNRCDGYTSILNQLSNENIQKESFHVMKLISLLKSTLQSSNKNFLDVLMDEVIQSYIKRLPLSKEPYKSHWNEIDKFMNRKSLPSLVSLLAKLHYDPQLYKLHEKLNKIRNIDNQNDIKNSFKLLSTEDFTDTHRRYLWQNSRFVYLASRMPLVVMSTLSLNIEEFPSYIPENVQKLLKERFKEHHEQEKFPLLELKNIDQVKDYFEFLLYYNQLPNEILRESITKNEELEKSLESVGVLFDGNWDSKDKITKGWDQEAIEFALEKLKSKNDQPDIEIKITPIPSPLMPPPNDPDSDYKVLKVHKNWKSLMGEKINIITSRDYLEVRKIIPVPTISENQLEFCIIKILPHIIQKVKMWGCSALTASNISGLVKKSKPEPSFDPSNDDPFIDDPFSDDPFSDDSNPFDDKSDKPSNYFNENKNPLSRIDCIAGLLSIVDCIVVQDILHTMAKFPMALPLVMPDFEHAKQFNVMLPFLVGPTIKWETKPGTIVENHLFKSPFRFLVAIRIGSNSKAGKSTILNQLMATEHMFSSICEPGASRGRPYTLSGAIEFTWLTQETCSDSLWKNVMENHYNIGTNEIVLLANLHGDALEYEGQVQWLKQAGSKFLVFIMPNVSVKEWKKLKNIIGSENYVYSMVDCGNKNKNPVIETGRLTEDETLELVRSMFKNSLESETRIQPEFNNFMSGHPLKLANGIECNESQLIVDFIKRYSCATTKNIMKFQKGHTRMTQDHCELWENNNLLQELMKYFGAVLVLPIKKRRRALAHLERDLYNLSVEESSKAREDVLLLREKLRRTIDLTNKNEDIVKYYKTRINNALEQVDDRSLGIEHLFREAGQIYESSLVNIPKYILQFPRSCAELFIEGQVIELIDGDSGKMPGAWLSSIFKEVSIIYPDLKVFVVSILGLQSSGKSTLLNALFSCRFAISIGRCTRGLFMRLLFFEKELKKELNVDAILLIDTEGLGAPEKINEKDASQKDRLLATFVMGISNLSLINVLGEYMNDLTEILQIAIVAMARLEKAKIAPDIFMVQHLTERNAAKTSSGQIEFCEALQNALKFADKKFVDVGIMNSDCLKILDERIQKGELHKQFRSFRDGASTYAPPSKQYHEDVTKLYEDILNACKHSRSIVSFKQWYSLVNSFWKSVKNEHFAVQFKNLKEMYEFIERGRLIVKVKEAINAAFQAHTEQCSDIIRQKITILSSDKNFNTSNLREECVVIIEEELNHDLSSYHCNKCKKVSETRIELENYLKDKEECKTDTLKTIDRYIERRRQATKVQLLQILEARLIGEGCTTEFMDVITNHLKTELKRRSSKRFNEYEHKKISDDIWNELRRRVGDKNYISSVELRIENEVKEAYAHAEIVYRKFIERDKFPARLNGNISKHFKPNEFLGLADEILKEKNAVKFESGMIFTLQSKVNQKLEDHDQNIIWNVHLFALEKFCEKMQCVQQKWDRQHNPLKILERKESEYRVLIKHRLEHGFTYASEGNIIAEYLLKAIRIKAVNSGNEKRMRTVLTLNWMNSTEHARLKYFKQLAKKVQIREFEDALKHFDNPQVKITEWFKKEVDNSCPEISSEEYIKVFEQEFKEVMSEVSKCKSIEEFQNFVESYLNKVEGCEYKMHKVDETNEPDVDSLRDSILETLKSQRWKYKYRKTFKAPSEYEIVMERLGCTESCMFCGAICWGAQGHEENTDNTKKHHSCHQPSGLRGTNNKHNHVLDSAPCHLRSDDSMVSWGKIEDRKLVKWSEAKQKDFTNWLFLPHNKINFNNLMCWFFQELHAKIAATRNLCMASNEDLQKYNCINLDYDQIIRELNVEIEIN
ncbi:12163_t:CDS:2 [Cetraspora pellucida]|uniref:12163_t:CDS:1 n=1 Tax=Cetraspora pellucida TaxID=1433469 RepID=A0A9N8W7B7_9GLOM|nr:12163_t:CDS:2 [Cetraspora pellucida]